MWRWMHWLRDVTAKPGCQAESSQVLRHLRGSPEVGENAALALPKRGEARVRLLYDVQRDGSNVSSELPFVVGVLADFQGHHERTLLRERSFLAVDRDNFDETMRRCDVCLRLRVADAIPASGNEQLLDLRFATLGDFAPSSIARQIALTTNDTIQSNPLLATRVARVLHHPDFLKLEGTWRGLHYLVNHVAVHPQLQVRILNLSKTELAFELGSLPEVEESRIYRRIVDDTYGSSEANPFGVLIGDYQFTHDPTDVEVLTQMAELAAAACCPFVAAASPGIFGLQNWSELHQVRHLTKHADSAAHAAWNRFRDRDDARYIVLTGPRTLGRPPYTKGADAGSGSEFDELTLDPDSRPAAGHARLCWMNTAFILGARLCEAFVRHGLCVNLTADVDSEAWDFHSLDFEHWQHEARIVGLLRYTVQSSEGPSVTLGPLEVAMTGRRESELHQCGVLTLCDNKLATAFHSMPTCHRPRRYDDLESSVTAAIAARLDHVLVVSRFAHYLKVIYKNLGEDTQTIAVQDHLEKWLFGYVNVCGPSDPDTLTRYPLCTAHLEVRDDPQRPGGRQAVLYLNSWLFHNPSNRPYHTTVRLD